MRKFFKYLKSKLTLLFFIEHVLLKGLFIFLYGYSALIAFFIMVVLTGWQTEFEFMLVVAAGAAIWIFLLILLDDLDHYVQKEKRKKNKDKDKDNDKKD